MWDMTLTEARNSVLPSTLANRLKILHQQSQYYQARLNRVVSQVHEIQQELAALAPKEDEGTEAQ
jgi:hypothetical protein